MPDGQARKKRGPAKGALRSAYICPPPTNFHAPGMVNRKRLPNNQYSDDKARKICERLMFGDSLKKICEADNMPSRMIVIKWLAHPDNVDFREMYYYAKRISAEQLVDEIVDIADDTSNDWKKKFDKQGEHVGWEPDNEAIQRSRVRIDTRKWLAAKMLPRLYGDKLDMTMDVTGDLAELLKKASNNDKGLPEPVKK